MDNSNEFRWAIEYDTLMVADINRLNEYLGMEFTPVELINLDVMRVFQQEHESHASNLRCSRNIKIHKINLMG